MIQLISQIEQLVQGMMQSINRMMPLINRIIIEHMENRTFKTVSNVRICTVCYMVYTLKIVESRKNGELENLMQYTQ